MEKKRVLMAMSGGIDSTVAAMLLLEQGYELVGVTYRTFDNVSQCSFQLSSSHFLLEIDGIIVDGNLYPDTVNSQSFYISHHDGIDDIE